MSYNNTSSIRIRFINKSHPEHLGPDGTISTQAPGVMSRASATRRGERTPVSEDLVRDCDLAMWSLDAPAVQPDGSSAADRDLRQIHGAVAAEPAR